MKREYPIVERIREMFSYDQESGTLIYRVAPYRKPALLGQRAGRKDKRDGIEYVNVDGDPFSVKNIIALHVTGKLPAATVHHSKMTLDDFRAALNYDPETGAFTRLQASGSAKVGMRADYVENNGYRYVILNGKRFIAARLAWLFAYGEWPSRVLRFQDGDQRNCAIRNLDYGKWDQSTPEGRAAYDKAHRKGNPEWHRKHNLRRDFGISLEQYQDAFADQGGVCACCHKPEVSERDGKRKWLAVDHDHADGSFRGLLCSNCNQGLGRFSDDAVVLRRAADYIEAHAAKPKTNIIPLAVRRIASVKGD